jgi:hypothetical protein
MSLEIKIILTDDDVSLQFGKESEECTAEELLFCLAVSGCLATLADEHVFEEMVDIGAQTLGDGESIH